jgi:EAL domain-containing protein (putative c-di-GMP-specific phosphodiesterase class I)
MYRAKRLGKARFVMFDPMMHTQAMARLQLEADLRQALEHDEFRLYYQPIISLGTGSVTGFEALLRWQHPERGLVAPLEYLAVAEEIGLILRLGRWVLREACHQLRVWLVQFPMIQQLTMSVNLSGTDFLQSDLIKVVEETLVETGLDASGLKLEITETVIMDNAESATATLQAFKARKIETCIDDFGTGYSSLSYLQQFPIDTLKIDKSFVTQMEADAKSFEIIRTIVTLAHSLGKKVIAEGIETAGQLALLKALKCEYGQGFFFACPLPQEAVHAFMAAGRTW